MKVDLQKLLDLLAEGKDLKEALAEVNAAELSTIESEAIEAGRAIQSAADKTPGDLDKVRAIVSVAKVVREVSTARATEAAELNSKLDAEFADLFPKAEEEETPAEEAPAEEAPAEEAPVVEAVVPETPAEIAEPIAAAAPEVKKAPRVNLAEIRNRVPAPKPPVNAPASYLFASADVPGIAAGAAIDMNGLAAGMERRLRAMGSDTGPRISNAQATYAQVASLHRPMGDFVVNDDPSDMAVLAAAADEKRLKGGSLTAANTWCAPSEIFYDFCTPQSTLEGLISTPSVRARRGGVKWTVGPDFCEVYENATTGFWRLTEAQVDAQTVKPCFEIPCPEFEECRLDALGMCITGGLLMRSGYPEVIQDWVNRSTIAFAHWRNAQKIAEIVSGSTDIGTIAACGAGIGGGATGSLLSALELQIQGWRERNRLSMKATVEVKLPFWVLSVLRADLAQRTGVENMLSVTDQQLISHFALRGASVEFLYDWQALTSSCATGAQVTEWPSTVQVIMYTAGTWVEVTQPIISIDARFDASLTETNRYGIRFTEEGVCWIKRCKDSYVFNVDLCPTGATTAPEAACLCGS